MPVRQCFGTDLGIVWDAAANGLPSLGAAVRATAEVRRREGTVQEEEPERDRPRSVSIQWNPQRRSGDLWARQEVARIDGGFRKGVPEPPIICQ